MSDCPARAALGQVIEPNANWPDHVPRAVPRWVLRILVIRLIFMGEIRVAGC